MPSITNITTTGGLTFQIEVQPAYVIDKDWSNFLGVQIESGSNFYFAAVKVGTTLFLPTKSGSMYISTDGGITWQASENGVRPFGSLTKNISSVDITCITSNGQKLIAINTTFNGAINSLNGVNWNYGLANSSLINRYVLSDSQGQFIGIGRSQTSSNNVYYKSNDGLTWTQTFGPSTNIVIRLIVVGSNEIYGVPSRTSDTQWYYSSDNGNNWVLTSSAWGSVYNYGQIVGYAGNYWISFTPEQTIHRTRVVGSSNIGNWISSSPGVVPLGAYNMLAYSDDAIVAVGNQGLIIYVAKSLFEQSPTTQVWSTVTSGTTENLTGIMWEGTKFIVNGNSGIILTSTDGITWVPRRTTNLITATTNPVVSYGFNNNSYFMLIEAERAFVSTDSALTWSVVTIKYPASNLNASWRYVTYGNGLYVAAVSAAAGGYGFVYSVDGLAWQASNIMSPYGDIPYFIFYADTGPYKFISATNSIYAGAPNTTRIYGSPNGTTWTQIYYATGFYISGGIWDGINYVLSTNNGIIYSSNGVNWSAVTIQASGSLSTSFTGIAFNGSTYVLVQVVNNYTTNIYASTNLLNWTLRYTYSARPTAVNYTNDKFIVATTFSILTSNNGISWENTDNSFYPVTGTINSISQNYMFGQTFYLTTEQERTIPVDYLVVGGGGSGGGSVGGGGGAGGVLTGVATLAFRQIYKITIGAGGTGVAAQQGGNSGSNTIFHTYLAEGGGGGASSRQNNSVIAAKSGGSGGGGSWYNDSTGGSSLGGLPSPGQGFAGGDGANVNPTSNNTGAGGGGAGGSGGNATTTNIAGNGGVGIQNGFTGTILFYAGGGGGGSNFGGAGGTGGSGVGGNGGKGGSGSAGLTNRGGGGGGGWFYGAGQGGGAGGSGVVVLRYSNAEPPAVTTGNPVVLDSGGYRIYTFTGSGSFQLLDAPLLQFQYLVVAGGGGGGQQCGGGGGAGGLLYSSSYAVPQGTTLNIIVGAGGATDTPGSNSSFGSITCIGGGGGGIFFRYDLATAGGDGGSGGGGASIYYDGLRLGGTGVPGQGNAGGDNGNGWNNTGRSYVSGGGGGAGAVGNNAVTGQAGNGGIGLQYFGNYYAGGGGGGVIRESGNPERGFGGLGGGGDGGKPSVTATSGTTNTGGGGGGAGQGQLVAGNGGSGVVIIKYINTLNQATTTGNPNFSNVGGFYTYTFTGSGSITFN